MKVATETKENVELWSRPMEFSLPKGLIGLSDVNKFEMLVNEEELPFMWIRGIDRHELGFVVIEPSQILNDYIIEISDEDIAALGIQDSQDALVLNIVTIPNGESLESATVNLIGPLVINKKTLVGRQIITCNYQKYTSKHPLLQNSVSN
ncbi:flagellar assembly protein FliW [Puniceicoccaceae bacterium K14]|nr:flagellar assembly protein FliW [Puniceicoccaceae bacterium K14]